MKFLLPHMSSDHMSLNHVSPDHMSPGSHDVRLHVARSYVARSHVARSHFARSHVSYHMFPDHMSDYMSDRMSDRMLWCESTSVTQHLFKPIISTLTSSRLFSPDRVSFRSCSCPYFPATPTCDRRPVTRGPRRSLFAACPPADCVARHLHARCLGRLPLARLPLAHPPLACLLTASSTTCPNTDYVAHGSPLTHAVQASTSARFWREGLES